MESSDDAPVDRVSSTVGSGLNVLGDVDVNRARIDVVAAAGHTLAPLGRCHGPPLG